MSIRRIGLITVAALLCLSVAACGKNKEPNRTELATPQYSIGESTPEFISPPEEEIHTSDQGIKVIQSVSDSAAIVLPEQATPVAALTPATVWAEDNTVTYNAFTLPEIAAFEDGSIGALSVSKIGLNVKVFESADQMEDMEKGLSHFKSTTSWDGNIGLSGHNRTASGNGAYFKDLHLLALGDTVVYTTAIGEREYKVTEIRTISEDDWSWLSRSTENKITMITCVNNNASKRLMIQASQV